jgi:hypothetical protein
MATGTMAILERGKRPDPPKDLTDEEAEVWRNVVDSMPPDWFSAATFPLLGLYCRHTAGLGFIDKMIRVLEKSVDDPKARKEWRLMSTIRRRECKAIAMLAVKMRLAQQSSYDRESVHPHKRAAARVAAAAEKQAERPWG